MNKLLITLAAVMALPAYAQDATQPMAEAVVVADVDGNGSFSLEELQAVYTDLTQEVFVTLDTDADGALNAEELKAAQDAGTLIVVAK